MQPLTFGPVGMCIYCDDTASLSHEHVVRHVEVGQDVVVSIQLFRSLAGDMPSIHRVVVGRLNESQVSR